MIHSNCECKRPRVDPGVEKIPLQKRMATHSSTLAWKIPWTEEPGGLQSMELQTVGRDWATIKKPSALTMNEANLYQLFTEKNKAAGQYVWHDPS